MLVLHDPKVLAHDTIELLGARLRPALESPARIVAILSALAKSEHTVQEVDATETEALLHVHLKNSHEPGYLQHLQQSHSDWVRHGFIEKSESILPECFPSFSGIGLGFQTTRDCLPPKDIFARSGYYAFDMSSGIMSETYISAVASAGLACKAASVLSSPGSTISEASTTVMFALCRPPGHHCDTRRAGGYCYLNNAVVATELLLSRDDSNHKKYGDESVAILDIDFHHGNGTQSYFYERKVTYVSIHGQDEYPYYTGGQAEKGSGAGSGYTHNFPLPSGTTSEDYLRTLECALDRLNWEVLDYLVLSLGFDTFRLDPLGSFRLDVTDYKRLAQVISAKTAKHDVRTVILLEGGYVIEQIGDCFVSFCDGWGQR